ncbi:PIN domain-containing protein [Aliiroseovarius sp. F47248L]|uniref:PIN domain-containing protein n=1 Tax=Aliiroseovarius sp. F47248L TaxID=2926420 RepID=UPI001FF6E133|nr:PIN domain-containing protein [Aliiroseovarius sp. F47248L]MCK0137833.1 PIN domain-containing protein [Aliiroseovarius sp. F47248L]
MPILSDDQLAALLAESRITAISVDTSIFDQKRLQLNSASMQALAGLKDRPFDFLLSGTVAKEVLTHLEKAAAEALQSAKKSIGKALFAFETNQPEREALLAQISGGRTPLEASNQRWDKYIKDTGCEVLNDTDLVSIATIFDGYFSGEPPFGSGGKKAEFPDALALNALERVAVERNIGILVISKDGDWKEFCEKSSRLYLVPEIERALSLITNAPLGLRTTISTWLQEGEDSLVELQSDISAEVERLEFTANAHPTHGEVELYTWAGELKSLEWPGEDEIDFIELPETGDKEILRVVVSLPLSLVVKVPVELSFSIWDSVDKESLGMGGRMIEVDEELEVRTTVTLDVHCFGTEDEEVVFVESELDSLYHEIELGEVDVYDLQDLFDVNEEN